MVAFILLGLLGLPICVIMAIISATKGNGKVKKWGVGIIVSFVLFVFGAVGVGVSNTTTSSSTVTKPTDSPKKVNLAEEKLKKETEEKLKKEKAKKEAARKAKEEADKKAQELEKLRTATAEIYKSCVDTLTQSQSQLQDTTYSFIKNNYLLFPAKTQENKKRLSKIVNTSIKYKHITKNINPYLDKVMKVTGKIVKIEEVPQDTFTLSYIHIITDDMDSYEILYLGKIDVFEKDAVMAVGVPAGLNSFENISGGTTLSAIIIAGDVKKIQIN